MDKNARKAVRDYIFLGVASTENHHSENEYVKLFVDISAGDPVDMSLLMTKTESNGGNTLNQSRFEEQRQSDILHASKANSIKHLSKQTTFIIQRRVDNGEF